jgi:hypothetical protein
MNINKTEVPEEAEEIPILDREVLEEEAADRESWIAIASELGLDQVIN